MVSAWPGQGLATALLRRGCFLAERAFKVDGRALAALYAARGELARLQGEATEAHGLQLRAREHLHAASWSREAQEVSFFLLLSSSNLRHLS